MLQLPLARPAVAAVSIVTQYLKVPSQTEGIHDAVSSICRYDSLLIFVVEVGFGFPRSAAWLELGRSFLYLDKVYAPAVVYSLGQFHHWNGQQILKYYS